ncbi:hypothetical protein BDZ94DRAFT_1245837 [Collybia nuda]|uniref:Pentatricopeptide repeat-containing protein n=1 Tax=Collybia nuda TaxID=64659 RepID=A0A9P5YGN6_9AGAR|nr:hypothetical protein BDZ94DRAFT_1245837 [Collybia nuda]
MFHCRRLLSQVHISPLAHRRSLLHRSSLNEPFTPAVVPHSNRRYVLSRRTYSRDATPKNTSLAGAIFRAQPVVYPASIPQSNRTMEESTSTLKARAYQDLRARDRGKLADLPAATYRHVLNHAFASGSDDLVNSVVLDIVEVYRGKESKQFKLLMSVMSRDITVLNTETIALVLRRLQNLPGGLDYLSTASIEQLARVVITQFLQDPNSKSVDIIYPLLHPLLVARLERHKAPGGADSITFFPPRIIHAAFGIIHILLTEAHHEQALDIFHILVNSGQIPPEAIQGVDSTSNDFKEIVCSALIKASLHWNWRKLAVIFVTDLIESYQPPHRTIIDLNIDVIYALLDTPTVTDIHACGHLIRRVHHHSPVHNSIIQQFYTAAAQLQQGAEAETMYAFSRSSVILAKHIYPSPNGSALPFLMDHLISRGRKKYLSRQLATEVVNDNLSVPLHSRARFIAQIAAQGYGSLSRQLWERYSIGKDGHIVLGDSALMIRMVSLFSYLTRQSGNSHRARYLAVQEPTFTPEISPTSRTDVATFRDRVMSDYRKHHEPLAEAPHQALTSLARACFIVGKFTEGVDVFKHLLNRKELPDIYDVNVALSAMAKLQPELASSMIARMADRGLEPDAVTYGTVMHCALVNKNMPLVNDMLERIYSIGTARLTLKSVTGMIRAIMAGEDGMPDKSKSSQGTKLSVVLKLVESLADTSPVLSPQTGKFLVFAALRAEEPVMAYKFWRLMLQHVAQWGDKEQRFLRRLIARMLRRHRRVLGTEQVTDMVLQLRQ